MGEDWEETGLHQIRGPKGYGCNVLVQRVALFLSRPMHSRTGSLHPPGHPATAAMLWKAIKHTFCSREWKLVDAHKTGDHMRNQEPVSLRRSSYATKRAYASYGFSLWCCGVRVTSFACPWPASRWTHLSHKPCRELFVTVANRCHKILTEQIIVIVYQDLPFGFVFWRHGMHVLTRTRQPSVNMGRRGEKTTTKDKQ